MKEYIAKVAEGENLTEEEAKGAMDIMLSGCLLYTSDKRRRVAPRDIRP